MNEKLIERKLREAIKQKGGLALKIFAPFFTGMPDRLILLPGGRVEFVELKSTGDNQTPRQRIVTKLLRKLGFNVSLIDDQTKLTAFLNSI